MSLPRVTKVEPMGNLLQFRSAMLILPQGANDDASVCSLPSSDEVNFYQVISLYFEESAW